MRRCEQNQQGFTLVELMAAVLITVVIVAATMTTVVTSNRANVVNTQVADTQQNVQYDRCQGKRNNGSLINQRLCGLYGL